MTQTSTTPSIITHEWYVNRISQVIRETRAAALTPDDTARLAGFKLTYGAGDIGVLGETLFDLWELPAAHGPTCTHAPKAKRAPKAKGKAKRPRAKPKPVIGPPAAHEYRSLVSIYATGQESYLQLCGVVAHELAHAIIGAGHGHGPVWYAAVARIGLVGVHATFTEFTWANFVPELAEALRAIPTPTEGRPLTVLERIQRMKDKGLPVPPAYQGDVLPPMPKVRPCQAGVGVRFGVSRGPGSGSRHILYMAKPDPANAVAAACDHPQRIRMSHKGAMLGCLKPGCLTPYVLVEASLPPASGMGVSAQGVPASEARENGARPLPTPRGKGATQAPFATRPTAEKPDLAAIFGLGKPIAKPAKPAKDDPKRRPRK